MSRYLSWRVVRSIRRTTPTTICPAARPPWQASTSTACAPSGTAAFRRAWPAADGFRRLERRHEPGGDPRQGRERLAGLLPVRSAPPVRQARRRLWRPGLRRTLPGRGASSAPEHRAACLGWRVVPPRLVRRWHAARFGKQHRMPDRFDLAELVGALRCGRRGWRPRAFAPGDAGGRRAAGAPRVRARPAARSALRQVDPRSRLHPGLRAGRAGERRAVHPWRQSGRRWPLPNWARASAPGSC